MDEWGIRPGCRGRPTLRMAPGSRSGPATRAYPGLHVQRRPHPPAPAAGRAAFARSGGMVAVAPGDPSRHGGRTPSLGGRPCGAHRRVDGRHRLAHRRGGPRRRDGDRVGDGRGDGDRVCARALSGQGAGPRLLFGQRGPPWTASPPSRAGCARSGNACCRRADARPRGGRAGDGGAVPQGGRARPWPDTLPTVASGAVGPGGRRGPRRGAVPLRQRRVSRRPWADGAAAPSVIGQGGAVRDGRGGGCQRTRRMGEGAPGLAGSHALASGGPLQVTTDGDIASGGVL